RVTAQGSGPVGTRARGQVGRDGGGPAGRVPRGRDEAAECGGADLRGDRSHTVEGGVVTSRAIAATAVRRIMAGAPSDAPSTLEAWGPTSVTPRPGSCEAPDGTPPVGRPDGEPRQISSRRRPMSET